MRLFKLKIGEKDVIIKALGHGGFRKRIVEMGFVKGKTVEILLSAPLKDPIKYKVTGYEISLRHRKVEMIKIIDEQEMPRDVVHLDYHEGTSENMRLSEKELKRIALGGRRTINAVSMGDPNCGKTSLFNIASGLHKYVGNYNDVTVDAKEGHFDLQGYHLRIVDLPGTYSLSAYSPEEIYVRYHVINETSDTITNAMDSSDLECSLYLTTQLVDMSVRMVIALNMYDELGASGNTLGYVKLGQLFDVSMLPTISRAGKGIEQLFHVIIGIHEGGNLLDKEGKVHVKTLSDLRDWHEEYVPNHDFGTYREGEEHPVGFCRYIHINHGPELEWSIEEMKCVISVNENIRYKYSTRLLVIKLLENDGDLEKTVQELPNGKDIIEVRNREKQCLRNVINEDSGQVVTDAKHGLISGVLCETYVDNHEDTARITHVIDSIVTHRVWGYLIFFLFLYLVSEGAFILGDYPMQGTEQLVGILGDWVRNNMPEGPLRDLLVDGIIGGVGKTIVFLPSILTSYFFVSLMEDSGYMARVAFIMDKITHKMGLHGKFSIPLIVGFGCNVPAIMVSRTIGNRRNRSVAMFINPLMSYSARLPIYLLLAGAFFPNNASLVLLVIHTTGILLVVAMARLFCRFLVKGDDTPFVIELPPYHIPASKFIFHHTWEKGVQYLHKIGGVIMIISIVIWALGHYLNYDVHIGVAEQQGNFYVGRIGKAMELMIKPLGFDWKLGVDILSGVGARELVVSTLGALYADGTEADVVNLGERTPITPSVAFCYMVFVPIYFPYITTLAVIKEELGGWEWVLLTAVYTIALARIVVFAIYQIGGMFG